MYSRNTWDRRDEYSIPPGYDGSRFRRRRRRDASGHAEEEVIVVPDSSYAPVEETSHERSSGSGELSIGGIPTGRGIERQRRRSAIAENELPPTDTADNVDNIEEKDDQNTDTAVPVNTAHTKDKISGIIEKLGFQNGLSSDDLLLCAVIFIIASDTDRDGRSVGDILLILALLLGIR